MADNAEIIKRFYTSFSEGNANGMTSCYAPGILFEDPAFGQLKGEDARNMWRMLVANSKGNIKIIVENIKADEKTGFADWTAAYVFSQTGRKVVNKISARFEFENGLIIKHTDHFSLWNWSRQALGWKGLLLGWTPALKSKVQKQTNALLKAYINHDRKTK
ncbi:MAG: nuclear transport factor 2 family protein [Bacteroidota bacterium]|nr:nuclear transport factor 2 family protein [Bacteroidota bacterium]